MEIKIVSFLLLATLATIVSSKAYVKDYQQPLKEGYQPCDRTCSCSSEYRPFCGSNMNTYKNLCHFQCANKCIPGLKIKFEGECHNDPCPGPKIPPTSVASSTPSPVQSKYCPHCGRIPTGIPRIWYALG